MMMKMMMIKMMKMTTMTTMTTKHGRDSDSGALVAAGSALAKREERE